MISSIIILFYIQNNILYVLLYYLILNGMRIYICINIFIERYVYINDNMFYATFVRFINIFNKKAWYVYHCTYSRDPEAEIKWRQKILKPAYSAWLAISRSRHERGNDHSRSFIGVERATSFIDRYSAALAFTLHAHSPCHVLFLSICLNSIRSMLIYIYIYIIQSYMVATCLNDLPIAVIIIIQSQWRFHLLLWENDLCESRLEIDVIEWIVRVGCRAQFNAEDKSDKDIDRKV